MYVIFTLTYRCHCRAIEKNKWVLKKFLSDISQKIFFNKNLTFDTEIWSVMWLFLLVKHLGDLLLIGKRILLFQIALDWNGKKNMVQLFLVTLNMTTHTHNLKTILHTVYSLFSSILLHKYNTNSTILKLHKICFSSSVPEPDHLLISLAHLK